MPKGKVERYKIIHYTTCEGNKVIARFDRSRYPNWHVPADIIMARIRRHYKKHHPEEFKEMTKKGVRTRAKRK